MSGIRDHLPHAESFLLAHLADGKAHPAAPLWTAATEAGIPEAALFLSAHRLVLRARLLTLQTPDGIAYLLLPALPPGLLPG